MRDARDVETVSKGVHIEDVQNKDDRARQDTWPDTCFHSPEHHTDWA